MSKIRLRTKISIVIVSSILTLCCIETAFRIFQIQPIPKIKWREAEYHFNSKGIRDYEYDYEKKTGVFRIVATGDSMTFGAKIPDLDDIYLKRVEKKLNENFDRPFEVINGARAGWNTVQEYEWLKSEGVKYAPDLIIVVYFFNDATDLYPGLVVQQTHVEAEARSQSRSRLYKFLKFRLMRKIISRRTLQLYKEKYFSRTELFNSCKKAILDIKRLSEEHGAKLLFVIFPSLVDLDDDYCFQDIHDLIYNFLTENAIETHSFLPAYRAYEGRPEFLWINIIDTHPNELAHAIAAESLYDYLFHSDLLN